MPTTPIRMPFVLGTIFYMTASSFDAVPGLPILHSKDLVNWKLIGHALAQQVPVDHFNKTQHGNGVWAPTIRYHQGEFYIYYPDPDFGIYLVKAKNPKGPWSSPKLVVAGKGLIDPTVLWDNTGSNYLAYAFAGSRAGLKSVLILSRLNDKADRVLDAGKIIYDGHEIDPTIEGPKLYKRGAYYYIFAPAGGVATGWQTVLRAKNIYGPYERKVVMHQGASKVNGPHQGAWVNTSLGEDWFLHFQDLGVYGRVVHLQPMRWQNDWPIIGLPGKTAGIGEPLTNYAMPKVSKRFAKVNPAESDEFNQNELGLQWQWQANPKAGWSFLNSQKGALRLYAVKKPDSAKNLWDIPNLLLQKFPAPSFVVTTLLEFYANPKLTNEQAGLIIMGMDYASLRLSSKKDGIYLSFVECKNADKGGIEEETVISKLLGSKVQLRVEVSEGGICQFRYSENGIDFTPAGNQFTAREGKWIGAKVGLYSSREQQTNDAGYVDVDWFRISGRK